MHVDPAEIMTKAQALADTADDAESPLASVRSLARSARSGFPGDATGPFDSLVADLDEQDPKLLAAIRDTAATMRDGAESYLDQDHTIAEYFTADSPG